MRSVSELPLNQAGNGHGLRRLNAVRAIAYYAESPDFITRSDATPVFTGSGRPATSDTRTVRGKLTGTRQAAPIAWSASAISQVYVEPADTSETSATGRFTRVSYPRSPTHTRRGGRYSSCASLTTQEVHGRWSHRFAPLHVARPARSQGERPPVSSSAGLAEL